MRRIAAVLACVLALAFLLMRCSGQAGREIVVHPVDNPVADTPASVPQPDQVVEELDTHEAGEMPASTSLDLVEGETATVRILGKLYTLRLAAADDDGATIVVNSQDFGLRVGESFSFGDFLVSLDATRPASVLRAKQGMVDVTIRSAGMSVRDMLEEGQAKRYVIGDAAVEAELVLVSSGGEAAIRVGNETYTLRAGEDTPLPGGWLFLHYVYEGKGATRLDAASVTLSQNT